MGSRPQRARGIVASIAFLASTAAVLMTSATPVLAVTCDDVRALSRAQQEYWAKRLNLTAAQRHRIWLACYGQAHATDAKDGNVKPVADRR